MIQLVNVKELIANN